VLRDHARIPVVTPLWRHIGTSDEATEILVLLDAGLYSPGSNRYPSGGGIGAIIGPRIEGNRRTWGNLTDSVDDDFE
jgi:hypothetical protein